MYNERQMALPSVLDKLALLLRPDALVVQPHQHGLVDVCREWVNHSVLLDLLVEHHLGRDAGGETDALCHRRVDRLVHERRVGDDD